MSTNCPRRSQKNNQERELTPVMNHDNSSDSSSVGRDYNNDIAVECDESIRDRLQFTVFWFSSMSQAQRS